VYKKVENPSNMLLEGRLLTCLQRIEHAGYKRDIISRKPRRYDEDGYELDDDETDEQADAEVAELDPYADVKIERK
jgi:hypothetical protein